MNGSSDRVYRGGSWSYVATDCRSADRGRSVPGIRYAGLGFRPAKRVTQTIRRMP